MKFDSIILVGPAYNLYPLVNENFSTAELPFLGTPLLIHTINYIGPFSAQIFVFCLEAHKKNLYNLIKNLDYPIEVIPNLNYEGFGYCINIIKDRISKDNLILCRSDMYFTEDFDSMINYYRENDIDVLGSIFRKFNQNHLMCITDNGILKAYNTDQIPFIENEELIVTLENKIKNFFICKSHILKNIPQDAFSFKNNVIPFLIKNHFNIKLITTLDLLINNISSYKKQLECKSKALGCNIQNICCINVKMEKNNYVEGSIIGKNTYIGKFCKIKNCIIMDNVFIEDHCIILNSIIGKNSKILKESKLINCSIAPYFIFKNSLKASNKNFTVD